MKSAPMPKQIHVNIDPPPGRCGTCAGGVCAAGDCLGVTAGCAGCCVGDGCCAEPPDRFGKLCENVSATYCTPPCRAASYSFVLSLSSISELSAVMFCPTNACWIVCLPARTCRYDGLRQINTTTPSTLFCLPTSSAYC